MSDTSVLLLDLSLEGGLGCTLRGILELDTSQQIQVRRQVIPIGQHGDLGRVVDLCNPAIVFLILSQALRKQAPGMVQSVQKNPLIVVAEECEPWEIFELLRLGATDFITAPLNAANILPRLWRLLGQLPEKAGPFRQEHRALKPILGRSEALLQQLNRLPLIGRSDAAVLISGETGTGKELFARAIHELSPRAGRTFVPVNCGAIPVDLVESELFGHERGAFTSAHMARRGLVEEADGGTLFLDEMDSLPLLAQVKLLRFLQDKEYRPVGSDKPKHADVRVITATNIDVEEAVRAGRIRRDLYYRLNIMPVVLPPLRKRREDIPLLAGHFLTKYSLQFGKSALGLSEDARQKLILHDWPGNVRELEHTIARAAALSESDCIRATHLDLPSPQSDTACESFQRAKDKVISEFERTYLESLLLACHGNISKAAELAKKNRRAFWELLRKHRIEATLFRSLESDAVLTRAGGER